MCAAILPFLPGLAAGLLGAIPGIVSLARGGNGKGFRRVHRRGGTMCIRRGRKCGGRLMTSTRRRHHYRKTRAIRMHLPYHGRGVFGDILGMIPFVGPLIKGALPAGVGIRQRKLLGYGISTSLHRPYRHGGLLMPAGGVVIRRYKKNKVHKKKLGRVHRKRGGYVRISY